MSVSTLQRKRRHKTLASGFGLFNNPFDVRSLLYHILLTPSNSERARSIIFRQVAIVVPFTTATCFALFRRTRSAVAAVSDVTIIKEIKYRPFSSSWIYKQFPKCVRAWRVNANGNGKRPLVIVISVWNEYVIFRVVQTSQCVNTWADGK